MRKENFSIAQPCLQNSLSFFLLLFLLHYELLQPVWHVFLVQTLKLHFYSFYHPAYCLLKILSSLLKSYFVNFILILWVFQDIVSWVLEWTQTKLLLTVVFLCELRKLVDDFTILFVFLFKISPIHFVRRRQVKPRGKLCLFLFLPRKESSLRPWRGFSRGVRCLRSCCEIFVVSWRDLRVDGNLLPNTRLKVLIDVCHLFLGINIFLRIQDSFRMRSPNSKSMLCPLWR